MVTRVYMFNLNKVRDKVYGVEKIFFEILKIKIRKNICIVWNSYENKQKLCDKFSYNRY